MWIFNVLFYMLLCTQIIHNFKSNEKFIREIDLRGVEEQTTEGGGQIRSLPHLCEEQSVSSRTQRNKRINLPEEKLTEIVNAKRGKISLPFLRLEEWVTERMMITTHKDNELVFGTSLCWDFFFFWSTKTLLVGDGDTSSLKNHTYLISEFKFYIYPILLLFSCYVMNNSLQHLSLTRR